MNPSLASIGSRILFNRVSKLDNIIIRNGMYYVNIIDLTYSEKNLFQGLRKTFEILGLQLRIFTFKTNYSNSERSEQVLKQNVFSTSLNLIFSENKHKSKIQKSVSDLQFGRALGLKAKQTKETRYIYVRQRWVDVR